MTDTLNVNKLIDLVKARPVIWDDTVVGYRAKESKMAWQEVFREIVPYYDMLREDEKIAQGKLIQSKWTHLRDSWQKSYKKRKLKEQKPGVSKRNVSESVIHRKLRGFLHRIYNRRHKRKASIQKKAFSASNNFCMPHATFVIPNAEIVTDYPVDPDADTIFNVETCIGEQKHTENAALNISTTRIKTEIDNKFPQHTILNQNVPQTHIINVGENHRDIQSTAMKLLESASQEQFLNLKEEVQPTCSNQSYQQPNCEHHIFGTENIPKMSGVDQNPVEQKLVKITKNLAASLPTLNPKEDLKKATVKQNHPQIIETINLIDSETNNLSDNECQSKRHLEDNSKNEAIQSFLQKILLPRIKDFTESQMLDFETGVLQLVKKIKFPIDS